MVESQWWWTEIKLYVVFLYVFDIFAAELLETVLSTKMLNVLLLQHNSRSVARMVSKPNLI